MIRHEGKPANLDELSARIDAGDDAAYIEAATLLWGEESGRRMAQARARFNTEANAEVAVPDVEVPSGADCDRAAGWHLPNAAGV